MKVINLDKDIFEKAFKLCNKEYKMQEIFDVLTQNDDVEKQIAILKLENLHAVAQANLLVSHLTGQDGPIREAVAIKLRELILEKNCSVLDDEVFYPVYVDAVCDVNPNICRFVIEFLPILKNQNYLLNFLLKKLEDIFFRIDNPDKNQKNFLTVRLFNLYWCFEAVGALLEKFDKFEQNKRLAELMKRAISFGDYTIDEKIAKILKLLGNLDEYSGIADSIQNSCNFYVKRYFERVE